MRREIKITAEAIDLSVASQPEFKADMGAVVHFWGVVRHRENDAPIVALEYEVFTEMALHQFELIFQQIEQRWPVSSIRVIHRSGRVATGEPSLWVEVIALHREEAFAACQFLISEMKRVVPIWKRACGS